MIYISLKCVADFLVYPSEEILFTDKNQVLKSIQEKYQGNIYFQQGGKQIPESDLVAFVNRLTDKKEIVFDQWIHESKSIAQLLLDDNLTANVFGKKLEQHFLFSEFKDFLSPFLIPILLQKLKENPNKNKVLVASYLLFLNENNQVILENRLTQFIVDSWENVTHKTLECKDVADFNYEMKIFFDDEQIKTLNFLSKKNYAAKVHIIELAPQVFQHQLCSYPLALWIANQLNKIDLNQEHKDFVQKMFTSLKKGEGNYFKSNVKLKSTTPWSLLSIILIPSAIVCLILFFIFADFSGNKIELNQKKSSFNQFTKKERQQLDSLIRQIDKKSKNKEPEAEQNSSYLHLNPVDELINERQNLENKLAQTYTDDCLKAYELEIDSKIENCLPYSKKQIKSMNLTPFVSTSKNSGNQSMVIKNESQFQVQILIFDNESGASVYSAFILQNEIFNCKIKGGQSIIFIPGNNLGDSKDLKNLGPSEHYKHHFCLLDENFVGNLLKVYKVQNVPQKEIKLLFNQNEFGEFYVLDLYQALILP